MAQTLKDLIEQLDEVESKAHAMRLLGTSYAYVCEEFPKHEKSFRRVFDTAKKSVAGVADFAYAQPQIQLVRGYLESLNSKNG